MGRYLNDERMHIALGSHPKVSHIHKFGARIGIDTTSKTIWDGADGIYPWSVFDTPKVLTVVGASDTGKSITVSGLDANYDRVDETIAVGATGSVEFKRVYRAVVETTTNAGLITVTASGTTVMGIQPGNAQTLMCVYTIPRNYTGLVLKGAASASADKDMIIEFFGRTLDDEGNYKPFRIQHIANIYQNNYVYEFAIPLALPEKTDLDVRVVGYSPDAGAKVTAAFDIVLYEMDTDY